jgi:hypothetical protein
MADKTGVYSSSSLLRTGRGQLVGMVLSCSSGTPAATFYDNISGSGSKLFEIFVQVGYPQSFFFSERFALDFSTGLYLSLGANLSASVWWREY